MKFAMKKTFIVKLLNFTNIQELPDFWSEKKYKNLLEVMEYGDTSEIPSNKLEKTCLESLNTYDPEEAAKIVLDYVFNTRLRKGQVLSLSNEMLAEKIWEEYADLTMHEEFFNVNQLLYQAFSGQFPYPEAVQFRVHVTANEKNGLSIFKDFPEAALIRLLVAGMDKNTVIFRLFEEQIVGYEFKDAKNIIWQLKTEKIDDNQLIFDVISSSYWFDDFKFVDAFEAKIHTDEMNA